MKPVLLCICDGVGIRNESHGNAFQQAMKPNFDFFVKNYPHTLLEASGTLVGLPKGQMGNSEVGHTNIGAGRIVYQPLELINQSITEKTFFENKEILKVIHHVKEKKSKLHLLGLLSDGGIHSHITHLFALLDLCKKEGLPKVYLHIFTDGRDTLPQAAATYLRQLEEKIQTLGIGKIATISGRYYAMDRDNRYDRVQKAYDAITKSIGEHYSSWPKAIKENYANGQNDEFIVPCVLDDQGKIEDHDGVIFFNFRPDRLREIGSAITNPSFQGFPTEVKEDLAAITMMPVSDEVNTTPAFLHQTLENTLGEYVSNLGKRQLRIAETEKYAHVTYFFDGGIEKDLAGCKRILIPSPKVATYDLKPEMSAYEITDTLLTELDHDYDLIILNFANGDMVGHTGDMEATIKAVETVDTCLGKLYRKIKSLDGTLIITADHGNCDWMLDEENHIITSHSTAKVPFIITKEDLTLKEGKLADIAPTILTLMDLPVPVEMTGKVLIQK